jgi:hypothetical protein
MRKLAIGVLAVVGLAMAVPAQAQDFYVGVPGVGVEFDTGPSYHYRDRFGRDREIRAYSPETTGFDRREGDRCHLTIIRRADGSTVRERRCGD